MRVTRSKSLQVLLSLLTIACAACSGGAPAGTDQAPEVQIHFPPPLSQTEADTIVVRGTATASETITSLTVSGVLASTTDDFQNWYAVCTLGSGETSLGVDLELQGNDRFEDLAGVTVVRNEAILGDPTDLAFSQGGLLGPHAWYLDPFQVLRQDLFSLQVTRVTGLGVGSGPPIGHPLALAVDPEGESAFILSRSEEDLVQILEVDSLTGERQVLTNLLDSDLQPLGATDMRFLRYFTDEGAVDLLLLCSSSRKRLTVVLIEDGSISFGPAYDELEKGISEFDLSRGNGQFAPPYLALCEKKSLYRAALDDGELLEIASEGDGRGPIWKVVGEVTVLASGDILVVDGILRELYFIHNLAPDYPRELLSEIAPPSGLVERHFRRLKTNSLLGVESVVGLDAELDLAIELVLATGERRALLETGLGAGPGMSSPVDLDSLRDGFVVSCAFPDNLIRVSSETAARSDLSSWSTNGSTTRLKALCTDESGEKAIVFDNLEKRLLSVDIETGDQMELSGPDVGQGHDVDALYAQDLVHDADSNRILILFSGALVEVDLATGNRLLVSGLGRGTGEPLEAVFTLTFDPTSLRCYAAGDARVLEIDILSGNRRVLSGAGVGQGPEFGLLVGVERSESRQELIVVTLNGELFSVDVETGNRTLLTGETDLGRAPRKAAQLHWDDEAGVAFSLSRRWASLVAFDPDHGQWVTVSR